MFKTLVTMGISYCLFNENGRKLMNDMGNKLIQISNTEIKKLKEKGEKEDGEHN